MSATPEPIVVEATFAMSASRDRTLAKRIEAAMVEAIKETHETGDAGKIQAAMMAARAKAIEAHRRGE